MPKTKAKKTAKKKTKAELSPKERQQFFVKLYVSAGGTEDQIHACAKRAGMKLGDAKKLLRKPSVKADVQKRLEPIRMQQVKQEVLSEATDLAVQIYGEQLKRQISEIKLYKLDKDVAIGRLMQMCIGLNMHMFPDELRKVIEMVLVYDGAMQVGNTKRIIPADEGRELPGAGVYASIFDRTSQTPPQATNPSNSQPNKPDDGAADLYPSSTPTPSLDSIPLVLPPAGESIEDSGPKKPENPNVITVEVG